MSKKQGGATLLAVKIAPPRARRWVVSRERLVRKFQSVRECALISVQAPAGYGKTSLLARMRREWLAAGACAAWLALDENDDAGRFVEALLLSTYTALGRPAPAAAVEAALRSAIEPREAISTLLGDLADAARPTALVLDDVHALPEAVGAELLPYLAFNLPPNVHLILGTRRRLPFATSDLLAHGQFASFDAADLTFRLEETRALLHARCGERVDADTVARVHERVEGWPMGLQLVLVDVENEPDPVAALRRVAASGSGLDSLFADVILPRLDPEDVAFLTAVAPLEQFQAHLCAAVTGRLDCVALLERLRNDTPVLQAVEGSEWLRLHATCRDALLRRFETLPKADRLAIHWRAAQWLHAAGMLDHAAHHALAAERDETAHAWIAQGLYGLATSGRVVAARSWLERLPEEIVLGNDRLRIVAAWGRALSHESREAFPLTEPLIGPQVDPALRYEALQVRGAAAHYADDLVAAAEVSRQVGEDNPFGTPVVRAANAVLRAILALSRGDTVGARMELAKHGLPHGRRAGGVRQLLRFVLRWPELPARCAAGRSGRQPRARACAGEQRLRSQEPAGVPRGGGIGGRAVGAGPAGRRRGHARQSARRDRADRRPGGDPARLRHPRPRRARPPGRRAGPRSAGGPVHPRRAAPPAADDRDEPRGAGARRGLAAARRRLRAGDRAAARAARGVARGRARGGQHHRLDMRHGRDPGGAGRSRAGRRERTGGGAARFPGHRMDARPPRGNAAAMDRPAHARGVDRASAPRDRGHGGRERPRPPAPRSSAAGRGAGAGCPAGGAASRRPEARRPARRKRTRSSCRADC